MTASLWSDRSPKISQGGGRRCLGATTNHCLIPSVSLVADGIFLRYGCEGPRRRRCSCEFLGSTHNDRLQYVRPVLLCSTLFIRGGSGRNIPRPLAACVVELTTRIHSTSPKVQSHEVGLLYTITWIRRTKHRRKFSHGRTQHAHRTYLQTSLPSASNFTAMKSE